MHESSVESSAHVSFINKLGTHESNSHVLITFEPLILRSMPSIKQFVNKCFKKLYITLLLITNHHLNKQDNLSGKFRKYQHVFKN